MNKRHKPFDFDENIRLHARAWSKWNNAIRPHLDEADRRAREHPLHGTNYLLTVAHAGCRLFRRDLFARFGYLVPPIDPKSVWLSSDDWPPADRQGHVAAPGRYPEDPVNRRKFFMAYFVWLQWDYAFHSMFPSKAQSERLSHDEEFQYVRQQFDSLLLEMPGVTMILKVLGQSSMEEPFDITSIEPHQIAYIAGWVRSGISLDDNKRLRKSLKEMGGSPDSVLVRELPGTTLIELKNAYKEDGGLLHKLPGRVRNHLERMRHRALSSKEYVKLGADCYDSSPRDLLSEEFLAKEELNALIASADLAPREHQILELRLKDQPYRQIADELGITVGAVKTTMSRVRKKLEAVS